ncbi:MAG: hypothetical protein ABR497_09175, partial [Kiritimatiellia bacterium]
MNHGFDDLAPCVPLSAFSPDICLTLKVSLIVLSLMVLQRLLMEFGVARRLARWFKPLLVVMACPNPRPFCGWRPMLWGCRLCTAASFSAVPTVNAYEMVGRGLR